MQPKQTAAAWIFLSCILSKSAGQMTWKSPKRGLYAGCGGPDVTMAADKRGTSGEPSHVTYLHKETQYPVTECSSVYDLNNKFAASFHMTIGPATLVALSGPYN